jgi:hypothetical protein
VSGDGSNGESGQDVLRTFAANADAPELERRRVMLIATCNINNINKRIGNLVRWLKRSQSDIVCLGVGHKVPNSLSNREGASSPPS